MVIDTMLADIKKLAPHMQTLVFSKATLARPGVDPSILKDVPSIESIEIKGIHAANGLLCKIIGACPNLVTLSISCWPGSTIDFKELNCIENLKKLRDLEISCAPIDATCLDRITLGCVHLSKLKIHGCAENMRAEDLACIARLTELTELELRATPLTTNILETIIQSCTQLKRIVIKKNRKTCLRSIFNDSPSSIQYSN